MDDLLLTRATLFASTNPCSLSRRDMLEFVRLAGFDGTSPIMQAVAAEPDGLIKLAEKRASVPAGNACASRGRIVGSGWCCQTSA